MSTPRFIITDAMFPWNSSVNKLNDTVEEIKRERKFAKIRLAGTYVGIVLGAAGVAYVAARNQTVNNED